MVVVTAALTGKSYTHRLETLFSNLNATKLEGKQEEKAGEIDQATTNL